MKGLAVGKVTTLADNGGVPEAPGTLYVGEVMHARLKPFGHRFSYGVFCLLADIDRLDELGRMSRLLSVNRPGLVSFRESDHVERDGETLRQFVDRHLAAAGLAEPAARVLLLCFPRVLGYVFNPISVHFCYDRQERLIALIYAVRNTFGERHSYVAPVEAGDTGPAGVRQTRAKLFHVSPFIGMEACYHFRIMPPGRVVRLRIHETEGGEPLLAATFSGAARPVRDRTLGLLLVRFPFMTLRVMGAIHWQALKLWLKGARFHKSPPPPPLASYGGPPSPGRRAKQAGASDEIAGGEIAHQRARSEGPFRAFGRQAHDVL